MALTFEFALAQHYGVPTGYMDLSESFDVACFFATCSLDTAGKWRPCTTGSGVLYLLPTERMPIRPDALQPIGLQMLPRPKEQFGWLIVCGINFDFEDVPGLQLFEFAHDESVSRYFLDMFSFGRSLFPDDAMATVADTIMASSSLPEGIVVSVAQSLQDETKGLGFNTSAIIAEIRSSLGFNLQSNVEVFN
ncbi:FRG domain-containing protein, partial [Mesorhizobium sp.]|uniref:FRG domain-containing protein n=1 Tax=Mesorhizobium sp. TaxID=1871066 RepID=UPI0025D7FDE3